jgi:DNA-binding CsgD family transcriptional regulator
VGSPMTMPMVRADTLPDDHNWRDAGCEVSPSCLRCPLEVCRYDVPVNQQRHHARQRIVAQFRRTGLSVDKIAAQVGIARRTVFRLTRAATPKQSEVQRLRAKGLTTREIAQRIGRSERQVRRLLGPRQYPSTEEVRQYRAAGHSIAATVTHFGVSRTTVMRLSRGRR